MEKIYCVDCNSEGIIDKEATVLDVSDKFFDYAYCDNHADIRFGTDQVLRKMLFEKGILEKVWINV